MRPKPKYVRLIDGLELMSHVVVDKTKPEFLFLLQPHALVHMGGEISEKNELRGRVGLQSWPHFCPNEQVPIRVETVAVVSELTPEFAEFYFSAVNKPTQTAIDEPNKIRHPGDPDQQTEPDAFKDFVIDFTKLN